LKQIAILGSTGSIGRQTLAVVEAMAERFGVVALAAGNNAEELTQQVLRHRPELVSVATPEVAANLADRLRAAGVAKLPDIQHGSAGMLSVATHPAAVILVSAAVGVVGLLPRMPQSRRANRSHFPTRKSSWPPVRSSWLPPAGPT